MEESEEDSEEEDADEFESSRHPELARRLGLSEDIIFPIGFTALGSYEQKRLTDMYKNGVALQSFGLVNTNQKADFRFLQFDFDKRRAGVKAKKQPAPKVESIDATARRLRREEEKLMRELAGAQKRAERTKRKEAEEAAKRWKQQTQKQTREEKQEQEKEEKERRKQQREHNTIQRRQDVANTRRAMDDTYDTLPWARPVRPRGKAPVEVAQLPQSILNAFGAHLKKLETGRTDQISGQPLYRFVSYQSGKKDASGNFVFRGFVATVSNGMGGSSIRVGLSARSTALAAIMALAAIFDPRLANLASNTSWLMWLAEGGEQNASVWLEDPEVQDAILGPTPSPHSGGRPEGNPAAARDAGAVAGGVQPYADGVSLPTEDAAFALPPPRLQAEGLLPYQAGGAVAPTMAAGGSGIAHLSDEEVRAALAERQSVYSLARKGATAGQLKRLGVKLTEMADTFSAGELVLGGFSLENVINEGFSLAAIASDPDLQVSRSELRELRITDDEMDEAGFD